MAWYKVIIFVSSIGYTIQYPNTGLIYTIQTGSDVQITPVAIAPSNSGLVIWTVMIISSHTRTTYTSRTKVPSYISYDQVNVIFTITNVTTTMRYNFDLDDGAYQRSANVHIIVYGKSTNDYSKLYEL